MAAGPGSCVGGRGRGWSGSLKESREGIRAGRPSMSAGGAAVGTACRDGARAGGPAQESGREAGRTGGCQTPRSRPGSGKPRHRAMGRLLGPACQAARESGAGPGGQCVREQTAHLALFSGGTQTCRAPGPGRRPSPPRSCEAGRRSSGPRSGTAGGWAARAPEQHTLSPCCVPAPEGCRVEAPVCSLREGSDFRGQAPKSPLKKNNHNPLN